MRCRLRSATALAGLLMIASAQVFAQEADTGTIILDTASFWRVHYTLKPPVVRKADGVEPVQSPQAWLNTSTPLPDDDWMGPDFDDRDWSRFPGVLPGNLNPYGSNLGDAKLSFPALVCMRGKFGVTNPGKVKELSLSASYRGGMVVYLNGTEIARGHLAKGPDARLEQLAEDYREGEEHTRELGKVKIPGARLRKGVNVLAVELHRSAYQEKDVQKARRGRVVIEWGSCGLITIRLTAPSAEGIVPNIARPAGIQLWNSNPLAVDRVSKRNYLFCRD